MDVSSTLLVREARVVVDEATLAVQLINQYRLLSDLGRGTFSKVQLAQGEDGNYYAIKVFPRGVLERKHVAFFDKNGAGTVPLKVKIEGELRILQRLRHVNIARLEAVIDDPSQDQLFVVLEGLRGGQLMRWENSCQSYTLGTANANHESEVQVFQESSARFLFRQVLEGVAYLHASRVIHKDIKPDNIVLSMPLELSKVVAHRMDVVRDLNGRDGAEGSSSEAEESNDACNVLMRLEQREDRDTSDAGWHLLQRAGVVAKIIDFNCSLLTEDPDCTIFDAEGTQLFTPPECFQGSSQGLRGQPRDLWSMGCVLHTMLFGRCPFWASTEIMLQFSIIAADFRLAPEIVSEGAAILLGVLLAREPASRGRAEELLVQNPWLLAPAVTIPSPCPKVS